MTQNRYEVLSKIADGGLGSVYKAYDRNLRREVALKRVRAESAEEAERQAEQLFAEARTLSTLQHPHIVTIFDVGADEEGAFIVMELLKGETLEDIIERGALNEADFNDLATQSLEGMISAHSTGLIHLDIKPQNFMVIWLPSGKFQIKILDFGLSKIAHQPLVQETDEDGAIMGSIFFMSPEQFERSPVDARTDLYSLGCVYYYALAQHYPFQGETGPEVMASHMYHSFIPLAELRPDLPPFLHRWVEWLMSRQPDDRPASVAEAFEIFAAGEFPADTLVAKAALPPPNIKRGGQTSQLLRPSTPRPSRPGGLTQALVNRTVPRPVARPVNIAAAAAPKHLKPESPLPKWLTLWLPVMVGILAVLAVGAFLFTKSRRDARFEYLSKQEQPVGRLKDVTMLMGYLDKEQTSETAGRILGKLEGVDNAVLRSNTMFQRVDTPFGKKNLATAVATRKMPDALEPLLNQLDTTKAPDVRQATWSALGVLAASADLDSLIQHLKSDNAETLRAAESAIVRVAMTDPDLIKRSAAVLKTYRANAGTDDVRASLLRILGKLGSPEALEDLTKALKTTNAKIRTAAAISLGDWPNSDPMPALEASIADEVDPFIRLTAINSLGNLVSQSGKISQNTISTSLRSIFGSARDNREEVAILAALGRVVDASAATFFQNLATTDDRRKPLAETSVESIHQALGKVVPINAPNVVLAASKAELTAGALTLNEGSIINWFALSDHVSWLFQVEQPGEYEVQLSQAATNPAGRYVVTFGSDIFSKQVEQTSSATTFKGITAGKTRFTEPGVYRIWIRPQEIGHGESLMRLKEITIKRVGD